MQQCAGQHFSSFRSLALGKETEASVSIALRGGHAEAATGETERWSLGGNSFKMKYVSPASGCLRSTLLQTYSPHSCIDPINWCFCVKKKPKEKKESAPGTYKTCLIDDLLIGQLTRACNNSIDS